MDMECPVCKTSTLWIKTPVYENFKKVSENWRCSSCGHEIPTEQASPVHSSEPAVFSDEDKEPALVLFEEGEASRLCRYCRHYIVNPFRQWCGFHKKDVEATDTCEHFDPPEKE